ncbi:efflux RND transporter permease subunit [Paragemmobacter ruber]|uniref:AcrB/AcrD/AcrF family protein n=1 Tax=Paragemmobacter ruber TaxID=1985673 RepID=A0ABW9Y7L0_9RHOB|nr:efflux RND transporter permease subunit [Rhodobacter ruber]NBE08189.1 AcrB/AcrD/AcrF family protein [Rhodobacter ruber]
MRNLNLSRLAVTNPAVTLFAILVALAAGAFAYVNLGRAEDPTFTIKTMVVTAVWPGATADEMQNLVAEPMEKRIQELPELEFVRTFSRPGATVLQVQLQDSVRAAQPVWYQVRKKLDDLAPSLPQGVIGPFFDDEYGDVFSAIYMLTGEGLGRAELKAYAERLRTRLLAVEDAAKVALIGDVEERIWVEISHRRLATLGLSPQTIFDAIAGQNDMTAAGAIQTQGDAVQVRVSGGLATLATLRALPIPAGEATLRLGDIAEVRRGYEDPPDYLAFHGGMPTVGVGVAMAEGANVVQLGQRLEAEVAAFRADLPLGVEVIQTADQADIVTHAFDEFLKTFLEALVIVLVVSFVTLGWRTGIVVALSVPIVLAIVFVVMQVWGMNFDRITLGALIIALGLLVDDAIIAVEMMVVKIEQGHDRIAAASAAWSSTAFPMLTGTLVTAAGFLPVGLARSTSGEYAGNIFWVVGIALIVSWFVAVIVTPYLGMKLLPPPKAGAHHASYDSRLYRALRAGVTASLRARWWVIGATLGALGLTGVGMGLVQQQFFPTSARAELFIETRMPEGTSITATARAALAAEALVAGDPDVRHATTYVGAGAPRFFFALNPALPNPSFALTVIMAQDAAARDRLRARIEAAVAAGAIPEARIRVDQIVFGPPVGFPVQFRVIGPDPAEVRRIAADVRAALVANPNTVEPQFDWNEQAKALRVHLDQDRIRALGLNTADVSNTLQTLLSGVKVTEFRDGTELIDVMVRAPQAERADPSRLSDLTVLLPTGAAVPLSQLADVSYDFEEPILWRRNRDMVLTVRADVVPGVQAPTVTAQILPGLQPIIDALPAGYRIETGGAVEESAKANAALFRIFPLMFVVMLSLLMLQLRSFSKLFLVFLTAPLGAIGAVAALLLFNAPFGFVALLGVIALAGMIMRNTVILVDQIDHDLAAGAAPWDAVVESTVRRARPVVLTALAAILAMIPLARSVFWGPMAMAIMGGLIVATVLTLFFLPALYAAWFRIRDTRPDAAAAHVPASAPARALPPQATAAR